MTAKAKMTAKIRPWMHGEYAMVTFTDPNGDEWEIFVYDNGDVQYLPVRWNLHLPSLPKHVILRIEDFGGKR